MNQAETKRRQVQAIAAIIALITLTVISRLTGYNGVTYVVVGLETYAMIYTAVSGGVAEALGRVLRLRNAKGQHRNASSIRRNAMLFQLVMGAAGTVVTLVAAEEIAEKLFRVQYSSSILMLLAPAVFLRSVSTVLLGYSSGEEAELPTAVVCILRQVFILGFSLLFGRMLGNYGSKVSRLLVQENFEAMYGGVGVAIAVTLSEVFAVIFLILMYKGNKPSSNKASQEGMRNRVSFSDTVRLLCANRGARAGIQLLAIITLPLGFICLQKLSGGNDSTAVEYGVFTAGYGVVCGIMVAFVMALAIPIYSKAAGLIRREEHRFARTVFQSGVHIIFVHAGFMTVFLTVMAGQAAAVICPEQVELASKMLQGGSSVILFAALSIYFSRMLILTGKKYFVMTVLAIADVIYAVTVTVMLNIGKTGVLALVYGGMTGGAVLCIVLGMFTYRQMKQRIDFLQILIVPVAAACVAGLLGMLLGKVLTPHVGNLFSLLVCFAVSGVLYWAGLLLLRNFREQELEAIPGGRFINALGQMLHVL